jgi:shikimate kinase
VATRIVTLSAPFGAGGSVIGPAVAERLGIPFVDRAIPAAVAHDLAVSVDQALAHDQ